MEKQRFSFNDWSDEDESDENEDNNSGDEEKDASATKFGPIPRFSKIYSVQVNTVANVFECSCCHQERMGMPCRHIASVCLSNEAILGKEPKGFPLSSIKIFWWNKYYLYGTSQYDDHLPIKNALIALANNDTHGLPCPTQLDDPITYNCPEHILRASISPASDRLLNYDSNSASSALQLMKDRNNPNLFDESVPAGLSQVSYLPGKDDMRSELGDWTYPMEELSDTEDHRDSRNVLSRHYNEMCEAFNYSNEKEKLEEEFKKLMNDFVVRARGSAAVPPSSQGQRVSMLPASSKRRKTHGTSHY